MESTTGYTFTPCVGSFTSPGIYMNTGTLDKINTSAVFEIALVRLSETSDIYSDK